MKLVSLCPSITKLLFDLGFGDALVGITKYCVHPVPAVAGIEKVGGTKDPQLARIKELAPDWVFLNREENRQPDAEWLEQQGIPIHVSHPCTVAETLTFVRELGDLLNVPDQAAAKNAAIDAALAPLHRQRPGQGRSFAYLIWRKPWMTVNGSTYISNLIAESGARNVFADAATPFPAVEAEQLAAHNPDRVFLSSEPFPFKQKHIEELALQTGLAPSSFSLVDGELLSWHGGFTAEGLALVATLFSDD